MLILQERHEFYLCPKQDFNLTFYQEMELSERNLTIEGLP